MLLIIGLGNPGEQYEFNRHNLGYLIIDALAERLAQGNWEKDSYFFDSQFLKAQLNEHELLLMKPGTYMNESGKAVVKTAEDKELHSNSIWVIHDDTEIPFGEVRVKFGGTSGGHNGINSIDDAMSPDYWRIRVGVGRPESRKHDLADYVLANFTADERKDLNSVVDQTVSYLVESLEEGNITATSFKTKNAKEK